MLVQGTKVCDKLRKLVACLASDPALQQDLLQEGLVRLWQIECLHPGKTESWYIQNCRFCMLHWLAFGRSIDSYRRSRQGNRISLDDAESQGGPMEIPDPSDVVGTVSFNDLQAVLSRQLTPRERAVLHGLVDGLRLREIASRTRLSYPTALKYRRRIAALVSRLELPTFLAQEKLALARVPRGTKPNGAGRNIRTGVGAEVSPSPPIQDDRAVWPCHRRGRKRRSKNPLAAAKR